MSETAVLYTLPEVAASVKVEYRTLHTWVERGLLAPTYPTKGKGHAALLTADDLNLAHVLAGLRSTGCDMSILRSAAKSWALGSKGFHLIRGAVEVHVVFRGRS